MKKVEIAAYGAPEDVAHCVEAPDLGDPGPGEIVFDVLAFPINPADLSFCRGSYRFAPEFPATPGAECVGRVRAVGAGVSDLKPGDLVINLQRENWAQARRVRAEDAIPIPSGTDLLQAAMLRINPPTAMLLLEDHAALQPGDCVIQNVANSAVGRHIIVLAKARGVRTINVVRRDDVADELRALGADAVLRDGTDLPERAREAARGAPIRLGIDAISGEATRRIARQRFGRRGRRELRLPLRRGPGCRSRGADPARRHADRLYSGAWAREAQPGAGARALRRSRRSLARRRPAGAGRFDLSDRAIREALIHAQRAGRHGKILVLPNGPLG